MALGIQAAQESEQDLLRLYLADVGRFPLLTKDDEARLAAAIEAGVLAAEELDLAPRSLGAARRRELRRAVREGEAAKEAFVQSNLRLVVSIAKRYQSVGVPLLDLIQDGNLGLIRAVEKFDWRKGFKFSTYATWWIRQAVSRGIEKTGKTIRLPGHVDDILREIPKARADLEARLGRRASLAEVAEAMEMTEERLGEILAYRHEPRSLSEQLREDGDAELGDVVADYAAPSPFEIVAASLLPAELAKLLAPLQEREREILRLRFGLDRGEPKTLSEIGALFNLTHERVRQIETCAMSKLRHPSANSAARELIGT